MVHAQGSTIGVQDRGFVHAAMQLSGALRDVAPCRS